MGLTFLAGAFALWYPLAGWSPAYYLVSANFFGLMWAFLPFGGAVAGNVVLMLLILLRSLVTAGQPLASLVGWPLLSVAFGLGWAVLLALWMRSVMQESQRRQRLIEELEATRQSLAQAERQAGVLAERQRLAREIHDTLAQDFTSIVLHLEAADAALSGEAEPVRTHVARARAAARAAWLRHGGWFWRCARTVGRRLAARGIAPRGRPVGRRNWSARNRGRHGRAGPATSGG